MGTKKYIMIYKQKWNHLNYQIFHLISHRSVRALVVVGGERGPVVVQRLVVGVVVGVPRILTPPERN
jgi:hypothetical protein